MLIYETNFEKKTKADKLKGKNKNKKKKKKTSFVSREICILISINKPYQPISNREPNIIPCHIMMRAQRQQLVGQLAVTVGQCSGIRFSIKSNLSCNRLLLYHLIFQNTKYNNRGIFSSSIHGLFLLSCSIYKYNHMIYVNVIIGCSSACWLWCLVAVLSLQIQHK